MMLNSSTSQTLLEEIIKMSESAVMSAEESMRSAMLAKDQANYALTAARLMRTLVRSEESKQQLGCDPAVREDDQVSSSTGRLVSSVPAEESETETQDEPLYRVTKSMCRKPQEAISPQALSLFQPLNKTIT